jgi:transposase
MIALPSGSRIWIACGATDLRKGFNGLPALVKLGLGEDPYSGELFVFRGRRGDRVKLLWWQSVHDICAAGHHAISSTDEPSRCRCRNELVRGW